MEETFCIGFGVPFREPLEEISGKIDRFIYRDIMRGFYCTK